MNNRKIEYRESYRAYHKFNMDQLFSARAYMADEFGDEWYCLDPNTLKLKLIDCQHAATVFGLGFDQIYVNDYDIKPMVSDPTKSYEFKRTWLDYLNRRIEEMLGEDYVVFKYLYDKFEKEHWGGNEAWKLLSRGSGDTHTTVMWALKNLCFYRHIEGRTITFKTSMMIGHIFNNSLTNYFDPRIKVVYEDDVEAAVIYSIIRSDTHKANEFVRNMLLGLQDKAYPFIKSEVESIFPEENADKP